MKQHHTLGLGLFVLMTLGGCAIPIPIPNCRMEGDAVVSQVVDSETRTPIPNAQIIDATDPDRHVLSDSSGRFRLGRVYQWHAAYQWSVVSFPLWPFTGDVVFTDVREFKVIARNYDVQTFVVAAAEDLTAETQPNEVGLSAAVRDETLWVPSVPLKRSAQTHEPRK